MRGQTKLGCSFRRLVSGWAHREQLRLDILEGLEFQGIARRVQEKHGRLLACLAFEPGIGFYDELHAGSLHALRQCAPLLRPKDHAEMRYGYALPIDGIVMTRQLAVASQIGIQMTHELMAEKIEVHSVSGTAAFSAPQNVLVKAASLIDVAHLNGDMKRSQRVIHGN